jgi:hypothetical protein
MMGADIQSAGESAFKVSPDQRLLFLDYLWRVNFPVDL